MPWNDYANRKSGQAVGESAAWVEEGNVKLFVFTEQPTRCRFLTEDVSVESLMSELGVTREEAEDALYTKVSQDRWVMPKSFWEHQIKEIPGKRYFSTVTCAGRGRCRLCVDNDRAKDSGVSENKLLPYPVRKRFYVPAYFYELDMVLYVRAAQEFFDDVAAYINKNGSDCDFDVYKTGKGFDTKYKAVFNGRCTVVPNGGLPVPPLAPRDLSPFASDEEVTRRIEGGRRPAISPSVAGQQRGSGSQVPPPPSDPAPSSAPAEQVAGATPTPEPADQAEFTLPFGQYKGQTFRQLVGSGNGEYVKFLAENSAGMVQKKAREFLGLA